MISEKEIMECGWKNMKELNPNTLYTYPTFGYGIHKIIKSLVSADYFLRIKENEIEIWDTILYQAVFFGEVENKKKLFDLMKTFLVGE